MILSPEYFLKFVNLTGIYFVYIIKGGLTEYGNGKEKNMSEKQTINVGIGFATGRKNFQRVLRTYIYNFKESGLLDDNNINFNLFIAYDLSYNNTKALDYTKIPEDISSQIGKITFIWKAKMKDEVQNLVNDGVLNDEEAASIFGKGYAGQRNAVIYFALKEKMDYLIFLDDDEYPVAVTKTKETAIWSGQHVLSAHLKNIKNADITHGYHCGYVSPIPYIKFNQVLTEDTFSLFIKAISNDIVNWEKIKKIMDDGGVTYADTNILVRKEVVEVAEINHAKFISGSNLCINLTKVERLSPFFNPPGARGEDTFLSTYLSERKVLKVPCYTFHDGFSTYSHLLLGVLPIQLKFIEADSTEIVSRFYKACIGWIRYKPLLMYITNREEYEKNIKEMEKCLIETLPKICEYFQRDDFMKVLPELRKYNKNVKQHFKEYEEAQGVWSRITSLYKQE